MVRAPSVPARGVVSLVFLIAGVLTIHSGFEAARAALVAWGAGAAFSGFYLAFDLVLPNAEDS